jgi:hypothetical protein
MYIAKLILSYCMNVYVFVLFTLKQRKLHLWVGTVGTNSNIAKKIRN